MKTYKYGEIICCPYCGGKQEDEAQDYVVPNKLGWESACKEECIKCQKSFVVRCIFQNEYEVIPP